MRLSQRWKQTSLPNKLLIGTGAIVALSAIVQVGITIRQYWLMKESGEQAAQQTDRLIAAYERIANTSIEALNEARRTNEEAANRAERAIQTSQDFADAAKRQAATSIRSANAVEQSASVARQAFEIGERPFIVVESARIPNLAPNQPLSAIITFANRGRTPAQDVGLTIEIAARSGHLYVFGFPDTGARPTSRYFMAAGAVMSLESAPVDYVTVDDKFFNAAMGGSEAFMIHGKGSYKNVIGTEYPIEYCFTYHPRPKGFVPCSSTEYGTSRKK